MRRKESAGKDSSADMIVRTEVKVAVKGDVRAE
jgi:hypothetical protein